MFGVNVRMPGIYLAEMKPGKFISTQLHAAVVRAGSVYISFDHGLFYPFNVNTNCVAIKMFIIQSREGKGATCNGSFYSSRLTFVLFFLFFVEVACIKGNFLSYKLRD